MPEKTHEDLVHRHGGGEAGKSVVVNEYISHHPYPTWDQLMKLLEERERKGKARAGLAQEVKNKYIPSK